MKKNSILLFLLLAVQCIWSQTTETFETENVGSASFTDNGQVFNITSQAPAIFDVYLFAGGGWSGTGADNRFIDNSGSTYFNTPVQFTVSANGGVPFQLKSIYLFLSKSDLALNVSGNCTITGKLGGVTKFTATQSSPFNTSMSVTNGFTQVNLATYGGQDNSNTAIDQYVITTTGNIAYVSLDAMRWQCAPPAVTVASQTNVSCFGAGNGAASVSVAGAGTFTYDWSPGNPAGDGTASVSGLAAGTYSCTVTSSCGTTSTVNVTITQPSSALSATTSKVDVHCPGGHSGQARVFASGGTPPYTYLWSNGKTTWENSYLAAGEYSVTVKDAQNCIITKSVTVGQVPTMVLVQSQTNVTCYGGNNGSATVSVSGGTPGYTYQWMPSGGTGATATNLSAGTYNLTVTDASGCTYGVYYTINQPEQLVATVVQTNVACNGGNYGSALATAFGGTAPYTYSWSNGSTIRSISQVTAGNYTVTVTDANGCSAQKNITITEPDALTATTSTVNTCYSGATGSASVQASGGTAPYTYNWYPNVSNGPTASGLAAGSYSVTVVDNNGCPITKQISILQSPELTATISTTKSCAGSATGEASVQISGGTGSYTYTWSPGNISNDPMLTDLAPGNYSILVVDSAGCSLVKNFIIEQYAPLVFTPSSANVTCFNANDGYAGGTISGGSGDYSVIWNDGTVAQTRSGLAAGTYTITITDVNGCGSISHTFTITEPTQIEAELATGDIACHGGTATGTLSSVSGGTAPYTYLWDSGETGSVANNLSGGNQQVVITDATGCQLSKSFYIWEPGAINAYNETNNTRNVTCHGGNDGIADVSHTGGVGPFTYQWLPYGGTSMMATGLSAGDFSVTVTDSRGCSAVVYITISEPEEITASVQTTNATCDSSADGTASVSVTGATGDLSYGWSNGQTGASVTGLSQGVYTVSVTNSNGCTIVENFTITAPEPLQIMGEQTNITCTVATGSLSLNVTGGVEPYTYLWSNGSTASSISGLSEGGYSVTVTDATGCTAMNEFYIYVSEGIYGSAYSTPVLCAGEATGTAEVNIYGGSEGPFTYLWSNGSTSAQVSNLAPGTYSVVVTAPNGCSATYYTTIEEPQLMVVTLTTQNAACAGDLGSASVSVSGVEGTVNIYWSDGSTGDGLQVAPGNYSVTVVNNVGCSVTKDFTITAPEALTASITGSDIACYGQTSTVTAEISGGTPPYTYTWSNGATTPSTQVSGGIYTVYVRDANNCTVQQSVTITQPVLMLDVFVQVTQLNACYTDANGKATVEASGGVAPYTYLWSDGATTSENFSLTTGVHTVTVTDANGCSATANVTITSPPAVANDNCENAQVLFLGDTPGSNICTTQSAGSLPTCAAAAYDSWYKFNSGPNTMLTLNVGMSYALYSGSCGAFTELVCTFGQTTVNVMPNTVYYLQTYSENPESRFDFSISLSVPCLAPTGVTVAADASSVSANWAAAVIAPTEGYQYEVRAWEFPGTGTNGLVATGTASGLSTIVNDLYPNMEYTLYVRSSCGEGVYSEWTQGITFFTGFCQAAPASGSGNGITNVKFATVNNTTVAEAGNYGDYTALSGTVQRATTATVNVTTANANYIKIWADWNNDMDFTDEGEEVYSSTLPSNYTNAQFVIPASAIVGSHRIRIGAGTSSSLTPCYTGNAAAFEDYTLDVDTKGPVHLNDAACNSSVNNLAQPLYINNVTGAQSFRFRVTQGAAQEIITRTVPYFMLNQLAAPAYGVTYTVDVSVQMNGEWTDYGKVCTVSTVNPTPLSRLEICEEGGTAVASFAAPVYALYVPMASNYRFMVTSAAGTTIIDRPSRYFSINMLATYDYNIAYTVRVATLSGGIWSDYGDSCTIRVDIPTTTLRAQYCNGVVAKKGTAIYANNYPGAVSYNFRVTYAGNQYVVVRNVGYFFLSSLPVSVAPGTTVGVEVKVFTASAESAYGTSCQVTLAGSTSRPDAETDADAKRDTKLSGFPNPFKESFSVDFETESEEMVNIVVYDMTGKIVDRRTVSVNELPSLQIGDHFAAGVYNLILTQGETVKTLRVVKSVN